MKRGIRYAVLFGGEWQGIARHANERNKISSGLLRREENGREIWAEHMNRGRSCEALRKEYGGLRQKSKRSIELDASARLRSQQADPVGEREALHASEQPECDKIMRRKAVDHRSKEPDGGREQAALHRTMYGPAKQPMVIRPWSQGRRSIKAKGRLSAA